MTNLARPAERVVAFYNQRGMANQWIKEGKGAIKWTCCHAAPSPPTPFASSSMPWLYKLVNFMRMLAMPASAKPWSLTSLREKLIARREGR